MAALLDAQYGPTSVDEEQEMVVLQARATSFAKPPPHGVVLLLRNSSRLVKGTL